MQPLFKLPLLLKHHPLLKNQLLQLNKNLQKCQLKNLRSDHNNAFSTLEMMDAATTNINILTILTVLLNIFRPFVILVKCVKLLLMTVATKRLVKATSQTT